MGGGPTTKYGTEVAPGIFNGPIPPPRPIATAPMATDLAPPAPPPTPDAGPVGAAMEEAAAEERGRRKKGRASTILAGLEETNPVASASRRMLLG